MKIDCHVHLSAFTPGHGSVSPRLIRSVPFRFMRWHFEIGEIDASTDAKLENLLIDQLNDCTELDAAVVLAFDAVHDKDGVRDDAQTHLFVENDYVIDLSRRHPKVLFGASIHPYRKDAIAELERCVHAGAVLVKWLPITQGIDPSDPKCFAFYEALAHHKIPLLSHTGGETMLPNVNKHADPTLLLPAIRRGVKVIAAHCGTRSTFSEPDYLDAFVRLALEHEHFYGDTSALNLPTRWHAYKPILTDDRVRTKIIHGSDWPVLPIPHPTRLGASRAFEMLDEPNWLRRDIRIKQSLGFTDADFARGCSVLRINA
jgi:predicted TIM-barrel fold metal-dependent hydrolase